MVSEGDFEKLSSHSPSVSYPGYSLAPCVDNNIMEIPDAHEIVPQRILPFTITGKSNPQ